MRQRALLLFTGVILGATACDAHPVAPEATVSGPALPLDPLLQEAQHDLAVDPGDIVARAVVELMTPARRARVSLQEVR